MTEERAPYLTSPFNQPAAPGVTEEYRRARKDFTKQVNRAATAEESTRRLEAELKAVKAAAWDVCRAADELDKIETTANLEAVGGPVKTMKDYNQALRYLSRLISYPGRYQL